MAADSGPTTALYKQLRLGHGAAQKERLDETILTSHISNPYIHGVLEPTPIVLSMLSYVHHFSICGSIAVIKSLDEEHSIGKVFATMI